VRCHDAPRSLTPDDVETAGGGFHQDGAAFLQDFLAEKAAEVMHMASTAGTDRGWPLPQDRDGAAPAAMPS
jgi:hypothetical protein